MKMKNFTLLLIIVFGFSGYSQNEQIKMSEANIELLKKLNIQEEKRKERISLYLEKNPSFRNAIDEGTNSKYVYDIIDGRPVYKTIQNLQASRATKTNQLQVGGALGLDLDGTGMTVGVWDGGPVDFNHPEFLNFQNNASRVTAIDMTIVDGDTGSFSGHGTHVAGTIAAKGLNFAAKGMATNINIKSYNWANDESEMILAVNDNSNPIYLSNHSYGIPADNVDNWFLGAYTQDARDIDFISRVNPKYLIVASAGNSGGFFNSQSLFPGFDKLTSDKNSKNNLVIANANPSVTEQPSGSGNYELSTLAINSGSSQGPTDDLRVKPDLAADGTNLLSTAEGSSYSVSSGTSMSAPNTTGTLALLQQYYEQLNGEYMNSSTLKGLVCHTAIDANIAGPDPIFGWGFLDAKASAETITDANNNQAIVDELTLNQGQVYTYVFNAQAGENLSATISWTDVPGTVVANGSLNNQTPRLVNDLDLRVTKDGDTFLPWRLELGQFGITSTKGDNIRDNIEKVEIEVPVSGEYTLTVSHKGTIVGSSETTSAPQSQDFSLILTGNNLTLSVKENSFLDGFRIYPNPSKGKFNLSFNSSLNENVQIKVYDLSGRLVYDDVFQSATSKYNTTIDLSSMKSGIYISEVKVGNNISTHKLIVE